MAWTTEDEKILKDMQERKQVEMSVLQDCVARAVDTYLAVVRVDEVVNDLIANATIFRKVLEPFDKEK